MDTSQKWHPIFIAKKVLSVLELTADMVEYVQVNINTYYISHSYLVPVSCLYDIFLDM